MQVWQRPLWRGGATLVGSATVNLCDLLGTGDKSLKVPLGSTQNPTVPTSGDAAADDGTSHTMVSHEGVSLELMVSA